MREHVDIATLAMFQEGLLDASDAADIRAHLAGCVPCGQAAAELDVVTGLLASTAAPAMPAELSARIEAALGAEAAARSAGTSAAAASAPAAMMPDAAAPSQAAPSQAHLNSTGPALPSPALPSEADDAMPGRPGTAPVPGGGAGRRPGRRAGSRTGPGGGRPPRLATRPLARSRARLQIMAAAAAVVVLGGGGYAVAQLAANGASSVPGAAAARSQRPVSGPVANPVMSPAPAIGGSAGSQARISTVSSGTDYIPSRLASQVHEVLAQYPAGTATGRPSAGERALSTGVPGCVHAIVGAQQPRLVDVAHYRGQPAIIIVVTGTGSAPTHVWVAALDCSASRPDVITRVSLASQG